MSEEFLAVVKLVSGEEIVAKVTELEDDQIVIECPAMMNSSSSRRMNVNIVKVEPWIKSGRETTYIVRMDKVLTISEIFDEDIAHTYTRFAMELTTTISRYLNPTRSLRKWVTCQVSKMQELL